MERLTVACVQQRMHVPMTLDEYRDSVRRFLLVAVSKQARLVVFPELGGMMAMPPILGDFRSNLLKRADRGRRRNASFWQKMVGSLSGGLAGYFGADLRRSAAGLLDVSSGQVWETYVDLFGGLAREFQLTMVAPSAYLPDPLDGVIRNLAAVFDGSGDLLGTQAKVVLHPNDVDLAQPGHSWDVIQSEVGRIGVIIGGDVLYPEVGRLLAYQGADVLVTSAACLDIALYHKVRSGMLARMQDNQLFAAASFLVGRNVFARDQSAAYVGKSAVFAPQELTPRFNGVLVEMGGPRSEGIVTAEWDFEALRRLWESSDTPVRRTLSSVELGNALGQIYASLQRLPTVADRPLLAGSAPDASVQHLGALVQLDDLTVLGSHADQWPPEAMPANQAEMPDEQDTESGYAEEETDEMDALQRPPTDKGE